ncbi:MAG: hypothetical protein GXY88_08920 [Tissierellia bacterium]|nr:hypothetical protein [Tissierellia bacterium]
MKIWKRLSMMIAVITIVTSLNSLVIPCKKTIPVPPAPIRDSIINDF